MANVETVFATNRIPYLMVARWEPANNRSGIDEERLELGVAHRIHEVARNAIDRSSGREVLALVRNSA